MILAVVILSAVMHVSGRMPLCDVGWHGPPQTHGAQGDTIMRYVATIPLYPCKRLMHWTGRRSHYGELFAFDVVTDTTCLCCVVVWAGRKKVALDTTGVDSLFSSQRARIGWAR